MEPSTLDIEQDFLVQESKSINNMAGFALLCVFLASMSFGDYGLYSYLMSIFLFLIPGVIFLAKAQRPSLIIKINKSGFFYAGRFITGWDLFYDATVHDKMITGSYKDNFVLAFRYYAPDYSLIYTLSVPLTNTQDKSEEEIIEAINFFCQADKSPVPQELTPSSKV